MKGWGSLCRVTRRVSCGVDLDGQQASRQDQPDLQWLLHHQHLPHLLNIGFVFVNPVAAGHRRSEKRTLPKPTLPKRHPPFFEL
jgi:hypothetical protein